MRLTGAAARTGALWSREPLDEAVLSAELTLRVDSRALLNPTPRLGRFVCPSLAACVDSFAPASSGSIRLPQPRLGRFVRFRARTTPPPGAHPRRITLPTCDLVMLR